jgi:hypothetical protein
MIARTKVIVKRRQMAMRLRLRRKKRSENEDAVDKKAPHNTAGQEYGRK